MTKIRPELGVALALAALAWASRAAPAETASSQEAAPTTQVKRGDIDLKVYTTGELRATRTAMLVAPQVGGSALKIVQLLRTGARIKSGEIVIEFDPSEQQYNLEQSRSELFQAEQQITKANADAEVQAAQDRAALVKARFDVRRAELDVTRNELVSAIDAKKNLLKLEEAKRALAQLQQDIQSHAASNKATLAVAEEKRNKARLAMQLAQQNIENMRVRSPINGLVQVRENWEAAGGFFFGGMTLPEFREGDEVRPGNLVAQVLDTDEMELQAKVNESDRSNLKPGMPVEVRVDALPQEVFRGKIKSVAGMASGNMWGGNATRQFDTTFQLDKPDVRLRPGFTARLTVLGTQIKNVLYVPRQAIFEKNGKPVVYVKNGRRFEAREISVKTRTESRVAIEGLKEGTEVAMVNPEERGKKPAKPAGPLSPVAAGGPE